MIPTPMDPAAPIEPARAAARSLEAAVIALASRQHGVVARYQLIDLGMPNSMTDHRVRAGWLIPLHRGVYRIGPLTTPRTRIIAAILALPGTVASHRTVAGLRQFVRVGDSEPVDITVPGRRAVPRDGIRLHHVRTLAADDVECFDGIPVTSPARTLYDLSTVLPERDLERAVAEAIALRIVDVATLARYLADRPRGRGTARLRALLSTITRLPARGQRQKSVFSA